MLGDYPSFAGVIGLALGFSLGAFYGRSLALKEGWRKLEARLRVLNDSHSISVKTADGAALTLEEFVEELKKA